MSPLVHSVRFLMDFTIFSIGFDQDDLVFGEQGIHGNIVGFSRHVRNHLYGKGHPHPQGRGFGKKAIVVALAEAESPTILIERHARNEH